MKIAPISKVAEWGKLRHPGKPQIGPGKTQSKLAAWCEKNAFESEASVFRRSASLLQEKKFSEWTTLNPFS
jgi:hypothetical protein